MKRKLRKNKEGEIEEEMSPNKTNKVKSGSINRFDILKAIMEGVDMELLNHWSRMEWEVWGKIGGMKMKNQVVMIKGSKEKMWYW